MRGWLIKDRVALGLAAVALAVYLPAIWWGLPVATSGDTIRGWDVDGIAGIGPLAEFHNLFSMRALTGMLSIRYFTTCCSEYATRPISPGFG